MRRGFFAAILLVLSVVCVNEVCGQVTGSLTRVTIRSGGNNRVFHYYLPRAWSPSSQPVPLVFNWHGYGGSGDAFDRQTGASTYAERYGWATIAPTGDSVINGHNGGGCCCCRTNDDVQFARDMKAHLEGLGVQFREDAIFSMGFSNGGFMSHRLGCQADSNPLNFRAIGPLAGYKSFGNTFTSCRPSSLTTIIHIHGTSDSTIPYNGWSGDSFASNFRDYQGINQCSGSSTTRQITSTTTCERYSNCGGGTYVEFCTVQGGSHTWFNGGRHIDATDYYFESFAALANATLF